MGPRSNMVATYFFLTSNWPKITRTKKHQELHFWSFLYKNKHVIFLWCEHVIAKIKSYHHQTCFVFAPLQGTPVPSAGLAPGAGTSRFWLDSCQKSSWFSSIIRNLWFLHDLYIPFDMILSLFWVEDFTTWTYVLRHVWLQNSLGYLTVGSKKDGWHVLRQNWKSHPSPPQKSVRLQVGPNLVEVL